MATERLTPEQWAALEAAFPKALVDGLRQRLIERDEAVIDPELLGTAFQSDVQTVNDLLTAVARLGAGALETVTHCGNCDAVASPEDQAAGTCPVCGRHYAELDVPFTTKTMFRLPEGRESRDISWLVTVHGMNTDGPWQQDFSWIVANKLKYSAPVLILKYPVFRVMVLFARTQRLLVKDLGQRLVAAVAYAQGRGELSEAPDVVLHSYGTLLFAKLLLEPEFAGLKFGRVILAGAIVPPDHDWGRHVREGRLAALVAHCGDRDWVVELAQFVIPGAGPSGRRGFADGAVRNVRAAGYGHGSFFDVETIRANLAPGGPWDRFLTYPADEMVEGLAMAGPVGWRPHPLAAPVRGVLKLLAVLGFGPVVWLVLHSIDAIRAIFSGRS